MQTTDTAPFRFLKPLAPGIADPHLCLLKDALSRPTENAVSQFVRGFLDRMGRPYTVDTYGNITSDPNPSVKKVWFVGHMDTVHREHVAEQPLTIVERGDWLMAVWAGRDGKGCIEQTGIGGDDKVGVWACLEAALSEQTGGPPVGLFFPRQEESGMLGTKDALLTDPRRFDSATAFIQLDRQGGGDAIRHTNRIGVWTDAFEKVVTDLCPSYGFRPANGLCTDIGTLSDVLGKPSINIGCGYYNPHTPREIVNHRESLNALEFAIAIAMRCGGSDLGLLTPEDREKRVAYPSPYGALTGTITLGASNDPDFARDFAAPSKPKAKKGSTSTKAWSFEELADFARVRIAKNLGYLDDRVTTEVSPDGVAIYLTPNGHDWADKIDATGFATDHVARIGAGQRLAPPEDQPYGAVRFTVHTKNYGDITIGLSGRLLDLCKDVASLTEWSHAATDILREKLKATAKATLPTQP